MKRVIWKYEVIPGENELVLPKGAEFLAIGEQGRSIQTWWSIPKDAALKKNPESDFDHRVIRLVATGEEFEETKKTFFLGTVFLFGGALVWHAYEHG